MSLRLPPVLAVQEENGGQIMEIGQCLLPVVDRSGRNVFSRQGEIRRNAEDCASPTGKQDGFQQLLVSVRGFNEDLGLLASDRVLFQLNQLSGASVGLHWQVTVEYEALTIQPRGHQCEQYRRGAD